jgi:hypothetical protein
MKLDRRMKPVAILACLLAAAGPALARGPRPVVRPAARHDTSPPLRFVRQSEVAGQAWEMPPPGTLPGRRPGVSPRIEAPLPATGAGEEEALAAMPPPLASFEGIGNLNNVVPPDTVGAVGPQHIVEWVNNRYAVYDRQGSLLFGPAAASSTIWGGFGGRCEAFNGGDAIVLYDRLADRWVLTQLAFAWPHDFHQCIAVSATPDPTGPFHRYDFFFDANILNDYPKLAVWPDAYYVGVNQFDAATLAYRGQGALAFERDVMLAGGPARSIYFNLFGVDPNYGGMLPSDLEGPIPPPPGSPNYFLEVDDDAWWPAEDRLSLWRFAVNWANPVLSTFGVAGQPDAVIDLTAAGMPFDADLCGYARDCLLQPGGARLDALSDRLMWRLQYRNFGTHETLVANHTVDADGSDLAGVRWYEIRDPGGAPFVASSGTHAPDADSRWMASAAMDGAGDLAIAYNVTSGTTYPSIRYAGRRPGDPPGVLSLTEASLVAGTGYQTSASRWGDYSTLVVDPTDDCTFWYFGEYHAIVSDWQWRTRFGSFRFDECGQCPLVGRPALTVQGGPGNALLTWTTAANAHAYDVLEGGLSLLRSSGGDFAAATTACSASGVTGSSASMVAPDPPPGDGVWYLVRGLANECLGSLDDDSPSRVASRDAPPPALPASCP